ncbi:MAG: UPF0149 family protein [Pseudomonadales bacterium]
MASDDDTSGDYEPLGFEDLQALIESLGGSVSAAELHGMLTAELCVGMESDISALVTSCLQFAGEGLRPAAADEQELRAVAAQTLKGLQDPDMSFQMLLPDDDAELISRATALGEWCQGFMFGFAVAEKKAGLSLSDQEEIAEILQDYAAISKVEAELSDQQSDDSDESALEQEVDDGESEEDLMQLAEYVRVAALNVYAQCFELNPPGAAADNGSLTLH